MALSGTLETFSLPDVLRLLSSTKKTGLLALDGDRGIGRLWVEDGDIVAARAERSVVDDVDAVLFELLRFADAGFEFEAGATTPDAGEHRAVDDALDVAQARLEEWREIEAVVPSLDVRVRMVSEIDGPVEVDGARWRLLACVGTGASGRDVADHLAEGEFEVCRSLRELVDAGLVEVVGIEAAADEPAGGVNGSMAVADAFAAMVHAPTPEPEPEPEPEPAVAPEPEPASEVASEVDALLAPAPDPAEELAGIFGASISPAPEPSHESTTELAADAGADEDLLADLAHLSPKAAAAVEATWGAHAERDPETVAEAPATDGDDLDQNLLLRFLSSAKH